MTYESQIDMDTAVGEYLVQCAGRPLVRVLLGPGGIARVFPEPCLRPAPEWTGEWLEPVDLMISAGSDWSIAVEFPRGTVKIPMGRVASIDAVAQAVPLLLPGSPAGQYRIFTRLERVVLWLNGDGTRAAHSPLLETEGRGFRGDGRAYPASDYIFAVGARSSLAWTWIDPEEGVPGFTTEAPVDRIDWLAPSEMRKQPLDR